MKMPSSPVLPISLGAGLLLVAAAVTGHFLWPEIGWFFSLLFALMVELMVMTVLLIASTMHDPVRRWDLPPNPVAARRSWRAALAQARESLRLRLQGFKLPRVGRKAGV